MKTWQEIIWITAKIALLIWLYLHVSYTEAVIIYQGY